MTTFRPPQKINLSEWIEKEIRLPSTVSTGAPGRVRLYPFQRGIADAISDPRIRKITVLKSARVGYTTLLVGAIAHFAVNDPTLIIAYLPNEDMARSLVVSDLEPTFQESPALRGVLSGEHVKQAGKNRSTMLMRQFTGGSLKVMSADTPRSFRGHNARVVIMDEVDGMNPTKDGNPLHLGLTRTDQDPNLKFIVGSTPLDVDTSLILPQYAQSDQRLFEVCCVECNDFHEIQWKDIHWPEGKPEDAHWVCPGCGSVVEHKHKSTMVARGRWRITHPEVTDHAGFRINALSSPIPAAAWGKLASEFLAAKGDPESLKTFVNLKLGEGWRSAGELLDDVEIASRAEPFGLGRPDDGSPRRDDEDHPFPADVLYVSAGVDLQDDRAEITFVGFAEEGDQYVLGHEVIYGRYDEPQLWLDVDEVLSRTWLHPLGGEIGVDAAAVDSSSGSMMPHVYAFCFPRARRRILAIKGDDGRRPYIARSKQRVKGNAFWIVGVDSIKGAIFNRLRSGAVMHFSKDLPPSWFEQFAGEKQVVHMNRGRPSTRFVPVPGRRNEALDCTVYAIAANEVVTKNWQTRRDQLAGGYTFGAAALTVASKPRKAASTWL